MKCARCKEREKEIILKLSVNGKIKEIALCRVCAEVLGYQEGKIRKAELTEYIKNIIEDIYPENKRNINCKFCKTNYQEFLRKKILGCPYCYFYFTKPLENIFHNLENEYDYKHPIENYIEKTETEDELYIKAKTYLDYDDIEMVKKIFSKINNKNDTSKKNKPL